MPHWILMIPLWSGHHSSLFSLWTDITSVGKRGIASLLASALDSDTQTDAAHSEPAPAKWLLVPRPEQRGSTRGSARPSCEVRAVLSLRPAPAVAPTLAGWAASKFLRAGRDLGALTENLAWTRAGRKEEAARPPRHSTGRKEAARKLTSE